MRRAAAIALFVGLIAASAASAGPLSLYSTVKGDFEGFAGDVSKSLPFASTMGLNWSSAYIGKLPNFGVGLSAGIAMVPTTSIAALASQLGATSLASDLERYQHLGLPLPAALAELRVGGLVLPFDLGFKVGFIPGAAKLSAFLPHGMSVSYLLVGVEARYQLVNEGFWIPQVSVGLGYNHYQGGLVIPTGSGSVTVASLPDGSSLVFTDPDINFNWSSNSVDATIEVSKTLFYLLTPYLGAGLSLGWSSAGGGLSSPVSWNGPGAAQIDQYFTNLTNNAFTISAASTNLVPRLYGGFSVNLFVVRVDLTGMYNLSDGLLGATLGTRLQL